MGKTGAGKSSLCNALFAGEVSLHSAMLLPVPAVSHCASSAGGKRDDPRGFTWSGKVSRDAGIMLRCTGEQLHQLDPGAVADYG